MTNIVPVNDGAQARWGSMMNMVIATLRQKEGTVDLLSDIMGRKYPGLIDNRADLMDRQQTVAEPLLKRHEPTRTDRAVLTQEDIEDTLFTLLAETYLHNLALVTVPLEVAVSTGLALNDLVSFIVSQIELEDGVLADDIRTLDRLRLEVATHWVVDTDATDDSHRRMEELSNMSREERQALEKKAIADIVDRIAQSLRDDPVPDIESLLKTGPDIRYN